MPRGRKTDEQKEADAKAKQAKDEACKARLRPTWKVRAPTGAPQPTPRT